MKRRLSMRRKLVRGKAHGIVLLLTCLAFPAISSHAADRQRLECLQEKLATAPDSMTVAELKDACSDPERQKRSEPQLAIGADEDGPVEVRMTMDEHNVLKPFTIMAHKQNYILLGANNFQGYSAKEYEKARGIDNLDLDDTEAQFQLSIKTPLGVDLFDSGLSVWSAYTVRSFWQVYNSDISSPFRETNHEPEIWLQANPDYEIFGFKNTVAALGVVHQSNGQAGSLSRSWNRVYGTLVFERGNFVVGLRPWFRIQEDEENDDNPDISDYLGHGELYLAYTLNDHVFTLMSRNNLESGFSQGAIQLGWSFPLFGYPYLKGYIQFFSGYGESLIDYDRYVNRLGAGLLLTDLL